MSTEKTSAEQVNTLLDLAGIKPPPVRAALLAIFANGETPAAAATAAGINRQNLTKPLTKFQATRELADKYKKLK